MKELSFFHIEKISLYVGGILIRLTFRINYFEHMKINYYFSKFSYRFIKKFNRNLELMSLNNV